MDSEDTEHSDQIPGSDEQLYRDEALGHYLEESNEGDLLRASPTWANWTYRLLVVITLTGLAYVMFGSAPVYEQGPALLRVVDSAPINAPIAGTIASIDVLPGDLVEAGQVLGHFRAEREIALLPGHVLPQLEVGISVRLIIDGYAQNIAVSMRRAPISASRTQFDSEG